MPKRTPEQIAARNAKHAAKLPKPRTVNAAGLDSIFWSPESYTPTNEQLMEYSKYVGAIVPPAQRVPMLGTEFASKADAEAYLAIRKREWGYHPINSTPDP